MLKLKLLLVPLVALAAACNGSEPASEPSTQRPVQQDAAAAELPVEGPEQTILAFGDSLFAGYRLNPSESYPAQLQAALRAKGINASVQNAGVSGDTTAAGRQRFVFTLDAMEEQPDLLILELGGNDLLRGVSVDQARANLEAMVAEASKRGIAVLLMGMRAPPNYGADYQRQFDAIYPELAEKYGAALVPFFQEPIFDRPDLNQADRIHPTAEGVAALVEATLGDVEAALPES